PKREEYPPNYLGLIADQRRFLVRQAEFVSRKIGGLVSPYEYLVIAGAFDAGGDTEQAERFFGRGINQADNAPDPGMAMRGFARYLFARGQVDEGRAQYERAIAAFAGDTDRWRFYRGNTYERLASQEHEWRDAARAEKAWQLASAEFGSL